MFKNYFNRFAKNDFENAFPRIQSHAHIKNSRHFSHRSFWVSLNSFPYGFDFFWSSYASWTTCSRQLCDFLCCLEFSDNAQTVELGMSRILEMSVTLYFWKCIFKIVFRKSIETIFKQKSYRTKLQPTQVFIVKEFFKILYSYVLNPNLKISQDLWTPCTPWLI